MACETMTKNRPRVHILAWIPVILFLSFSAAIMDTIRWGGPYVIIPLAAWIGAAYGPKGNRVVLFGGLLLPLGLYLNGFQAGLNLDVYLISLLVCRICSSSRQLLDWVPNWHSKTLFFVVFFFLPLSLRIYDGDLLDPFRLVLGFDLYFVFLFFLFAAGLSDFRVKPLIISLSLGTVFGMLMDAAGWPPTAEALLGAKRAEWPILGLTELRSLRLHYGLNSPLAWLTGAGYFLSGRYVARFLKRGTGAIPPIWLCYGLLVFAGILALGSGLDRYLFSIVLQWPRYAALNFTGSTMTLILTSFMGGVFLRRRGVGIVLGLVGLFWYLNGLLMSDFDFSNPYIVIYLHQPLYAIAFGALGVKLRDRVTGQETFLFSWRWALYFLLLAIVLVPLFFETRNLSEKVALVVLCVIIVILSLTANYLRKRLAGLQAKEHSGWLSIVGIMVLASVAWEHVSEVVAILKTFQELILAFSSVSGRRLARMVDVNMALFAFFIPAYCWTFLGAVQGLLEQLPECIKDLYRLGIALKSTLVQKVHSTLKPNSNEVPDKSQEKHKAADLIRRITQGIRIMRHGILAVAILLPVVLLVIMNYPRDGFWVETKAFFRERIEEVRVVRDIPPVCSETSANPFLWQAALDYLGAKPILEADPCGYTGKIKTDWFITAEKPLQRARISIFIDRKLGAYSTQVFTYKQERRLGLIWVELADDSAEKKQIQAEIYSHANALASQVESN